jgi:hypothetical protein
MDATLQVDGHDLATSRWQTRLPRDGVPHELRVSAAGFMPARILFIDTPPPTDVHLEPLAPPLALAPGVEATAPEASAEAVASRPRRRATVSRPSRDLAARGAAPLSARPSAELQLPRKKKPQVQLIDDEPMAAERD